MNIGERIKNRRIELGITVDELANKLGKNRATIYRYQSGDIKDMPTQVLEPLARALETTPAELMGWKDDADRFEETAKAFNKHRAEKEYGGTVAIPVLRRVAAGIPLTAIDEIIGYEPIPENMATKGTFFALKISGDSMSPGILDGDIVICRQQPTAESGQITVVLIDGCDGICKRFKQYEDGSFVFVSDNANYPPIFSSELKARNVSVQIRGVVVEQRRKF